MDVLKEPKCKNCGHPPCPCCGTWCDTLLRECTCPKCAGAFSLDDLGEDAESLTEDEDDSIGYDSGLPMEGDSLACPLCKHRFNLIWDEHVEVELCCNDGPCEYDMPAEKVQEWCQKMLVE